MAAGLFVRKHPEIESSIRVKDALEQRQNGTRHTPDVDVLDASGDQLQWHRNLDNEALEDLLSSMALERGSFENPKTRIFFLKPVRDHWTNVDIAVSMETIKMLQEKAGLSDLLISGAYEAERWAKMGDFCSLDIAPNSPALLQVCYRYLCGWDTSAGYMQITSDRDNTTYFCINYPARAIQRLEEIIEKDPAQIHRKFLLDILVVSECLDAWQNVISRCRGKLVGEFETPFSLSNGSMECTITDRYANKKVVNKSVDKAIDQLHWLSRDWHILIQDLADFDEQIQFLLKSQDRYADQFWRSTVSNLWPGVRGNSDAFQFLDSRCKIYSRWVNNYKDRTNIRINLLFQLVNQGESRTNTEIAKSSAHIAEQTQRDSASMITIAAVTLLFLPGTFICSICSTIFFDYNDGALSASNKWWIIPASIFPSTIMVLGVWLLWWHVRLTRDHFKLHKTNQTRMPFSRYLSLEAWQQWSTRGREDHPPNKPYTYSSRSEES